MENNNSSYDERLKDKAFKLSVQAGVAYLAIKASINNWMDYTAGIYNYRDKIIENAGLMAYLFLQITEPLAIASVFAYLSYHAIKGAGKSIHEDNEKRFFSKKTLEDKTE
jgi:hypothetical protein